MDWDALKSSYADIGQETVEKSVLLKVMDVNRHPELKGIRRQLLLESMAWTVFLAFYYDFFDGHLKPILWNILLVMSVLLLLLHNMLGHHITSNPIEGQNWLESLKNYGKRIRGYALISIGARVMAIAMLFGYFLSSVAVWESRHYWSVGAIALIAVVQALLLWRIWSKRIQRITQSYRDVMPNFD